MRDRISLRSPRSPGTYFVSQAGLEVRDPSASASIVLGLKVCDTTTWPNIQVLQVHFISKSKQSSSFFLFFKDFLLCICVFSLSVCEPHLQCQQKTAEIIGSSGTGVRDVYELA